MQELMELLAQRDRMAAAHASTKQVSCAHQWLTAGVAAPVRCFEVQVSRSVREKQRTFNKRVKDAQSTLNNLQRDPESYSLWVCFVCVLAKCSASHIARAECAGVNGMSRHTQHAWQVYYTNKKTSNWLCKILAQLSARR